MLLTQLLNASPEPAKATPITADGQADGGDGMTLFPALLGEGLAAAMAPQTTETPTGKTLPPGGKKMPDPAGDAAVTPLVAGFVAGPQSEQQPPLETRASARAMEAVLAAESAPPAVETAAVKPTGPDEERPIASILPQEKQEAGKSLPEPARGAGERGRVSGTHFLQGSFVQEEPVAEDAAPTPESRSSIPMSCLNAKVQTDKPIATDEPEAFSPTDQKMEKTPATAEIRSRAQADQSGESLVRQPSETVPMPQPASSRSPEPKVFAVNLANPAVDPNSSVRPASAQNSAPMNDTRNTTEVRIEVSQNQASSRASFTAKTDKEVAQSVFREPRTQIAADNWSVQHKSVDEPKPAPTATTSPAPVQPPKPAPMASPPPKVIQPVEIAVRAPAIDGGEAPQTATPAMPKARPTNKTIAPARQEGRHIATQSPETTLSRGPSPRDAQSQAAVASVRSQTAEPLPDRPQADDQTPDESALNGLKPGQLDATAPTRASRLGVEVPTGSTAPRQLEVEVPVGHRAWADQLARQIGGLGREGGAEAHVRLNPAHLGPLEVRVHTENGETRIQLQTNHEQVREALETALPRLRETLQGGGFHLAAIDLARQPAGSQTPTGTTPQGAFQGFGHQQQTPGDQGGGRQSGHQTAWDHASAAVAESTPSVDPDHRKNDRLGGIDYWL